MPKICAIGAARSKAKMGSETERLKVRLEELERELAQTKTDKDTEIQQMRETAEKAQASLESELKNAVLQAELDLAALDALREEHQRALEREQKLVEEEKKRTDLWIGDLPSGFESEKQEKICQLQNLPVSVRMCTKVRA